MRPAASSRQSQSPTAMAIRPGRMKAACQGIRSLRVPAISAARAVPRPPKMPSAPIALPWARAFVTSQAVPTGW